MARRRAGRRELRSRGAAEPARGGAGRDWAGPPGPAPVAQRLRGRGRGPGRGHGVAPATRREEAPAGRALSGVGKPRGSSANHQFPRSAGEKPEGPEGRRKRGRFTPDPTNSQMKHEHVLFFFFFYKMYSSWN